MAWRFDGTHRAMTLQNWQSAPLTKDRLGAHGVPKRRARGLGRWDARFSRRAEGCAPIAPDLIRWYLRVRSTSAPVSVQPIRPCRRDFGFLPFIILPFIHVQKPFSGRPKPKAARFTVGNTQKRPYLPDALALLE
jgi:hypothetical protein